MSQIVEKKLSIEEMLITSIHAKLATTTVISTSMYEEFGELNWTNAQLCQVYEVNSLEESTAEGV